MPLGSDPYSGGFSPICQEGVKEGLCRVRRGLQKIKGALLCSAPLDSVDNAECYPLGGLTRMRSILNRSLAWRECGMFLGMTTTSSVLTVTVFPPMVTSASPSRT
jgi:hypothetical protein